MSASPRNQPEPDATALGRFAEASIALAAGHDDAILARHAECLALLTGSDLVLLYELRDDPDRLDLCAQWGLPAEVEAEFWYSAHEPHGIDMWRGVGSATVPAPDEPIAAALRDLGVRAHCSYPIWSDGELLGHFFFASRVWDDYHKDTRSVFAASAIQVARTLRKRRSAAGGETTSPSWGENGEESAAKKRQQFIAVLAHELRNPIAPIRSGLDLLSTGLLDVQERRVTLDMMQRQVVHLVRLIDDLLDTVRLHTGRLLLKREPVLLKDVVRSAIESIRPALLSKQQALRLDDEDAAIVVDVDPVRLAQAFVNILSANVNETPEGGVIAVGVAARPTELAITFEDEGTGVDPAALHNVFELFPESAAQKSNKGWGIGLAMVKGLVELNDGTVEVRNREAGHGAVYTVRLPVPAIDVACLPAADEGDPRSWPSHRILVVDDNQDAAETLGLLFELDGHTVRLAHDGPSAVAEANEFQPEVILLDIGLPVFDGNEVAVRIRRQNSPVRPYIIALTGWGAEEDRAATLASGCDTHLAKPVSHDELRRTILELTSQQGKR